MTQLRSLWRSALVTAVALMTLAGATAVKAQSDELALSATLDGNYANGVSITGGTWEVSDPEAGISMVFAASGLVDVNQFEFILTFEPLSAFDISGARFRPFVSDDFSVEFDTPGRGVEILDDDRLRLGAGVFENLVSGDTELGTLTLTTSSTFDPNESARILVDFFSIGPAADDRDEYDGTALGDMGVVVAAATAVESATWGSVKKDRPQH